MQNKYSELLKDLSPEDLKAIIGEKKFNEIILSVIEDLKSSKELKNFIKKIKSKVKDSED